MENANTQLDRANAYQARSKSCMCYIAIALAIVATVAVLLAVFIVKSKHS
jgi:t-SNARE complex subunit (syntaxin)